jgi:DNA-binding MarR family transcriptional regulator
MDQAPQQASVARTPQRPSKPVDINTVADLVTSMSRTVHALADHETLRQQDMGVAEWVMLRTLSRHSGMRAQPLARRLGVSPQRVNQLVNTLRAAGYIEASRAGEDSRARDITVTALGQKKLEAADKEVFKLFSEAFKGRTNVILNLSARANRLANTISGRKAKAGAGAKRRGEDRDQV